MNTHLFNRLYWNERYRRYRKRYDIDPSFKFQGEHIELLHPGNIKLGKNSKMCSFSKIACWEGTNVTIGDNTILSHYVWIYTKNKIYPERAEVYKDVVIGDNVFIGAFSFIGAGSVIEDNSFIKTHSVVSEKGIRE